MQQERLKADEELKHKLQGLFDFSNRLFITLPEYTEGTKFQYDISPANLCDRLFNNTVSPEQVYTVLSNTHNDYLVQVQAIMKERFDRLDFEPAHELQIIAYANFINNQVQKCTGSTTPWINFVPWSKHAWLWSEFIVAPPDPPDPPDIPEMPPLPRLLIASQMLSTSPQGPRLPWTPPLRLRPLLSMPPLRPLLLLITTPPPPPLRRRPVLASTLGVLCPRVAPTFSTPPP